MIRLKNPTRTFRLEVVEVDALGEQAECLLFYRSVDLAGQITFQNPHIAVPLKQLQSFIPYAIQILRGAHGRAILPHADGRDLLCLERTPEALRLMISFGVPRRSCVLSERLDQEDITNVLESLTTSGIRV